MVHLPLAPTAVGPHVSLPEDARKPQFAESPRQLSALGHRAGVLLDPVGGSQQQQIGPAPGE